MAGGARIAALHVDYETVQGAGNARGFATGVRFKLTKYPRQDQNWEYLILAADYQFQSDAFGSSGAPNTGPVFQCWFTALSSPTQHPPLDPHLGSPNRHRRRQIRRRTLDRPIRPGQGPIPLGLLRKSNERSSCWVRVAQPWAG